MPAHDKTPETQLLSNVRGIIAEYERAKLLERTIRGLRGRAKEGFVPSVNVPLGYEYVRLETKGAHYVINQDEASLVQRIFQMYVQSGVSINAIAQQLTRERIPTQSDRRARCRARKMSAETWQPSSIFLMLTNETYIGTLYYGKTESSYSPHNPDKKTTHRLKPREEWIAIPVPPIIDPVTFAAAQRRMQDNAQMSKRNRKLEYLLCNSRLRCGQCGSVMTGQFNPQREHRFYRCSRPPYHNPLPCRRTVSARAIEDPVWQKIEEVLQNPELIASEVQRRTKHADTEQGTLNSERDCFTRQLEQCDKEMKKWEAAYIADVITLEDFKARKAEIGTRRTSAEQELARLTEQQRVLEQAARETASLVDYCVHVRENLSGFSMEEKRLALTALNITVYWHPDAPLEIHGSIPVDFGYSTPGCAASLVRHRLMAQSRAGLWHGSHLPVSGARPQSAAPGTGPERAAA